MRNGPPPQVPQGPWWLPGGHLQTVWPALCARPWPGPAPRWRRERWTTPDGDFVDVDHIDAASDAAPVLVLFHGLEGSSASPYACAFAGLAAAWGWRLALPHFRGCSGEINRAPRAYHSGDHAEVGWMLQRLRQGHDRPLMAVGVSLGGNALLRWVQEAGPAAGATVAAAAAVCAPLDLAAGGHALGRGFGRQVYTRMFLRTMKAKALAKLDQFPGLFDRRRMLAAATLHAFDDAFTAPLHGFDGVDDYWRRASAKPGLARIAVPTLALNPRDDPFVPAASLPGRADLGSAPVTLWQPPRGGHVGFARGPWPGWLDAMPRAVAGWLACRTGEPVAQDARR